MAVSGGGTSWSDPYIVDNWADFLTVMSSSSNYVKFANPDREITGDGSSSNPFVVSTYEEMLLKTGATYIYQVKLIDRETKKYKYNDVYCIYDDSLTTIDFNEINPSGYTSQLQINSYVDFNGWTLKNIVTYYSSGDSVRFESLCKNAIISNMYSSGASQSYRAIHVTDTLENSVIDIYVDANGSQWSAFGGGTAQTGRGNYNGCAINLKGRGKRVNLSSASGYGIFNNCHINLDVNSEHFWIGTIALSGSESGANINNVLFTGDVHTTDSSEIGLGRYISNSIYDFNYTGNGTIKIERSDIVRSISFYNSEKMTVTGNLGSMTPATTAQLKQAQWLYNQGFPIGVDS